MSSIAKGIRRRVLNARAACLLSLWLLAGAACVGLRSNPVHLIKPRADASWGILDLRELGDDKWIDADFEDVFPEIPLGLSSPPCSWLQNWIEDDPSRAVLIIVHGIEGEGAEWAYTLPHLLEVKPAAVLSYRWSPYEKRDALVSQLAVGISRLASCLLPRRQPLVVYAHSAGGVLASYAASRIVVAPPYEPPRVTLVTVASPLTGFGTQEGYLSGESQYSFILDLGTAILGYPDPAPGVQTVHFRTEYPADPIMKPGVGKHLPNKPGVGVPGALHVQLPNTWGHTSSLKKIALAMADGRWRPWENFADAVVLGDPDGPAPVSEALCQTRGDILAAGDIFEYVDLEEPPDPVRVRFWEGSELPPEPLHPEAYLRCRPCDCASTTGEVQPWSEWEMINRRAFEHLRYARAPYPVVIVPGFFHQGIMIHRLRWALQLVERGWAAAIMTSGGHQRLGYNWARWMRETAIDLGRREFGLEMRDRIFVEPCSTQSLTHLRNSLRMMAGLGLRHGLFLVDSKMSMQSHVFFSQLEERVPRELQCSLGRVSYIRGDGPRPRLGDDANGCHPLLSWRSNPFGYLLSSRRAAVFWVSPVSYHDGAPRSALSCLGGSSDIVETEPDNQDAWLSTCQPRLDDEGLRCDPEEAASRQP